MRSFDVSLSSGILYSNVERPRRSSSDDKPLLRPLSTWFDEGTIPIGGTRCVFPIRALGRVLPFGSIRLGVTHFGTCRLCTLVANFLPAVISYGLRVPAWQYFHGRGLLVLFRLYESGP